MPNAQVDGLLLKLVFDGARIEPGFAGHGNPMLTQLLQHPSVIGAACRKVEDQRPAVPQGSSRGARAIAARMREEALSLQASRALVLR
ncbi:MAG TPA: hypothetical protein VNA28_06380 [Solirubrobacteraceae bacterium]|nr:hypothetical protein [Solirubrobacteraceae bacterium]